MSCLVASKEAGDKAPLVSVETTKPDAEVANLTASLEKTKLEDDSSVKLVDTPDGVANLVGVLTNLRFLPPPLYVDLEGVDLSRHGTISIMQIYVSPFDRTYLVDIYTLKEKAFSTKACNGQTLKDVLESGRIFKVFFDVRNDSDALYSHYSIELAGVYDLQLMELAGRRYRTRYVNGLARCIERDARLPFKEREAWKASKERGRNLFAPVRGGSYEIFNTRPLPEEVLQYCVQDVRFLPNLFDIYESRLDGIWRSVVNKAAEDRVIESKSATYDPRGKDKCLAPPGWESWGFR